MEPKRTYRVRNSERCFRFKPDAFYSHAPDRRGIYELVTFDEAKNPKVLFVGAAFDKSIRASLEGHLSGAINPSAEELLARHDNLYFDYLEETTARDQDDAQDIFWFLVNKYKPAYNGKDVKPSGRSESIDVIED